MKKSIKKAFTLAEIIFVMGIIGIVATLTVTNAKKDTDVAEKVSQLRKTEEILSTAFAQAVTENGDISQWANDDHGGVKDEEVWNIVKPYLKLKKECGTSTGCWKTGDAKQLPSSSKEISDNIDDDSNMYKGILTNGASIAINSSYSESNTVGVFVDVNGPNKGTYRYGDDILFFVVDNNGEVFPYGRGLRSDDELISECISGRGIYCTPWVLQFGNQDYLKGCRNRLSWNGPQTCR